MTLFESVEIVHGTFQEPLNKKPHRTTSEFENVHRGEELLSNYWVSAFEKNDEWPEAISKDQRLLFELDRSAVIATGTQPSSCG